MLAYADRDGRLLSIMERCVHFTGTQHLTCKAGVCYKDVDLAHDAIPYERRGVTYTATRSLPCIGSLNHGGATCAKREVPTEADARAQMEREAARLVCMGEAREAIVAQTENKGGRGTVPCPVCGAALAYSQASSNKHVHAKCATPGCLAWME